MVLSLDLTFTYQPYVAPFFFMCNFHGNVNELGIDNGEVALSVSIEGNPELYTPGKLYNGEYWNVKGYKNKGLPIMIGLSFHNTILPCFHI